MIADHQLSTFRDYVAEAFKGGMPVFPHFTLHGSEHLCELDRLALIIREVVPKLEADTLSLVRLASIMHDFAMVDVPSPEREGELRRQMDPMLSFADIVRKTHQNEIRHSFGRDDRREYLTRVLTTLSPHHIEDAVTVACFHRFHPLTQAPKHLRGHCALMRLIDELDIGPCRAPRAAYEVHRGRMDVVSRLHWLKHICTREITRDVTLLIKEPRTGLRILTVSVAVKATARSWRCLQAIVLSRLRECLGGDGVNDALSEAFGFKVEVTEAPDDLCGDTPFLTSLDSHGPPAG